MLRRRRTAKFKRNLLFSSPNRRRVMLNRIHKKIIRRGSLFAMQQMEEIANQELGGSAQS